MKQAFKKLSNAQQAQVDMNPMLDIVFILLIFFIVTTSFVKADLIDILRPKNSTNNVNTSQSVNINIDDTNQIYVAGRLTQKDAVSIAIARLSAEFDITNINLSAAADSQHNVMVQVLDQVKMMGDYPVAITTNLD